jgi:Acetyltransferase (GNAT) domain
VGIRRVNPVEDSGWDTWLKTCPSASFFHGASWARVLHDTYGFNPVYFTNGTVGRSRSVLPVMEVRSRLTGNRGISLPFSDECAPAAPDAGAFQALFHATIDYGKARGWHHFECRGGRHLLENAPASTSYFGHKLDLTQNEGALFAGLSGPARRAVRKAERSGLRVAFSESMESVEAFYGLLLKTRKKHGLPPQPFNFFSNIVRHILAERRGIVVTAHLGREPVASAIFFHFGQTAFFKFAASDEHYHHLRVNNHVMWEAIRWYSKQGFEVLDFGRTSLFNAGLRRFKLGWGTQESPIDYFRYDCAAGEFIRAKDDSAGWYNSIFRRLPTSLARLAGATLYKHAA